MKRKVSIYFLAGIVFLGLFSSCDIVDQQTCDSNAPQGDPNACPEPDGNKKVLIEDFTGHYCGNCPRAHEALEDLKNTYGDKIIGVAIHTGGFAQPIPPLGYTADYRTALGDAIDDFFGAEAAGLPKGLVNRREWNGAYITDKASWPTYAAKILSENPAMSIAIAPSFNVSTNEVTVTIDLEYFAAGNADHLLMAVITEDSIISKQEDYLLGEQEDYEHMHMLRAGITPGTWGVPVKGEDIFVGEKIQKTYTMALDTAWVPSNCNIVVWVADAQTKEVYQVEETRIIQ